MPPVSSRLARLAGAGADAWTIHFSAVEMAAVGRDVVFLTVGDPDFDTPEPIVDAAVAAIRSGRTHYGPIVGLPALREEIAAWHARFTGVQTTAAQVAVVPGAQAGIYHALQCVAGPDDEVIVPEPMYATYEAVVGSTGARLVNVPLVPERDFHLDLDALAAAVTPRTRVIWINTPHNPTGAVMTRHEVEAVADLAQRHDLWVVSDEVYARMTFDRPHISPYALPGMRERTIVVSSLSKSHAMTGFRLGWVIGPELLAPHLFNLILCNLYGGPPFIQDAALAALRSDLPEVEMMRSAYRRRAQLLVGRLGNVPGVRPLAPESGMFVLLDVRGCGLSSARFAERLLAETGVAVLPCDGFGASAKGHLRLTLACADDRLAMAADRIATFASSLSTG